MESGDELELKEGEMEFDHWSNKVKKPYNITQSNIDPIAIDVDAIIPPMSLIEDLTTPSESPLTLSLIPITYAINHSPKFVRNVTGRKTYKETHAIDNKAANKKASMDANLRSLAKIDIRKFLKFIISKNGISKLYSLEFSRIKYNPIIYSRIGRAHYNSLNKSNLNVTFGKVDLQKVIGLSNKTSEPHYKWSFMDTINEIEPYYKPISEDDKTLVFESRFESGNLGLATKINDNEYFLLIQDDSMSTGRIQCNINYINRVLFYSIKHYKR